jgi:hypothetical protein
LPSEQLDPLHLKQLLLGQQPLIEGIHPRQALADGGQHLFFQEGDFLFSIGLLDPGAAQRLPAALVPMGEGLLNTPVFGIASLITIRLITCCCSWPQRRSMPWHRLSGVWARRWSVWGGRGSHP